MIRFVFLKFYLFLVLVRCFGNLFYILKSNGILMIIILLVVFNLSWIKIIYYLEIIKYF